MFVCLSNLIFQTFQYFPPPPSNIVVCPSLATIIGYFLCKYAVWVYFFHQGGGLNIFSCSNVVEVFFLHCELNPPPCQYEIAAP